MKRLARIPACALGLVIGAGGLGCGRPANLRDVDAADDGGPDHWDVGVPDGGPECMDAPGEVPLPPSCVGLSETCGPNGNESCCTTIFVPGGTFNRSNDELYPATVADFWLDRYEITVGRYRKFLAANVWSRANPPAPGTGAHPLIPGSGWNPSWNGELPPPPAREPYVGFACGWAASKDGSQNAPEGSLCWQEAFLFCAWDGGRLPTEAEWNYAAAGGSEQRRYPWSSPPSSRTIDDSYAVYCGGSCDSSQNVGSKSPKGDGRWGHADLAGNVLEWTLDLCHRGLGPYDYAYPLPCNYSYPLPCNTCANLDFDLPSQTWHVVRGGDFRLSAPYLDTGYRELGATYNADGSSSISAGARCARSAQ